MKNSTNNTKYTLENILVDAELQLLFDITGMYEIWEVFYENEPDTLKLIHQSKEEYINKERKKKLNRIINEVVSDTNQLKSEE